MGGQNPREKKKAEDSTPNVLEIRENSKILERTPRVRKEKEEHRGASDHSLQIVEILEIRAVKRPLL